jgi:hypothetical protein
MPIYAIHQLSALIQEPVRRPRGAKRIAMGARKASVLDRRSKRRFV